MSVEEPHHPDSELGGDKQDNAEQVNRRNFLKGFGAAGALGGAAILGARDLMHRDDAGALPKTTAAAGSSPMPMDQGQVFVPSGRVDHSRNGFDPSAVLKDFDGGNRSRDASGNTVREYEFGS